MTDERREELAIKIIVAERDFRKGYEDKAFRSVLLILAELIGDKRKE